MKKIFIFLIPLVSASIVVLGFMFFISKNSGKGAIQVTSTPRSDVFLNGKLIGQTPLCKCEGKDMISTGEYTVRLVPHDSNFSPFEEKIQIVRSILTVVDRTFDNGALSYGSILTLSPISDKKDAQLLIISFPDKGNVFLDNNLVGITPLLLKKVSDVDHELKLGKNGYKDKSIKIKPAQGYRLISLIFLGVSPAVASASASNSSSQSASLTISKVTILNTPTGFLRVRKTNSIESAEVDKVYPGETFDLVNEQSGWFEIRLNNGKTGWISSQYAKK